MYGIIGAIPEEISAIVDAMDSGVVVSDIGMRQYHVGSLWGRPAVAVYSRIGKVAASSTVTQLIAGFGVKQVIFTGVAGGIDPNLSVGDIVVGGDLYQHDMDARPLFDRHEVPLLGRQYFSSTPSLRENCVRAATDFLKHDLSLVIPRETLLQFQITCPKVVEAGIASGDKFFANHDDSRELVSRLPVVCVEMEGAAVAQVCHEYGIDFGIVRTISNSAGQSAPIDFKIFVDQVASTYSLGIVKRLINQR